MITIRELIKNHGKQRVLKGVNLAVNKGEVAVVVGPSGGGKSTLLRCINGLEPFQAGEVRVDQFALTPGKTESTTLRQLRLRVGFVFQQFNLFPHLSVLENVMSGPLWALGKSRSEAEPLASELLARVGLVEKAAERPANLSGGQQQRVAIARALAVKPEVILFDEPTSALDPKMANEVLKVMEDLAKAGQTMMVVTHAMSFARRVATTVHVMHEGGVAESGPPAQVFTQPRTDVTREFLKEAGE